MYVLVEDTVCQGKDREDCSGKGRGKMDGGSIHFGANTEESYQRDIDIRHMLPCSRKY